MELKRQMPSTKTATSSSSSRSSASSSTTTSAVSSTTTTNNNNDTTININNEQEKVQQKETQQLQNNSINSNTSDTHTIVSTTSNNNNNNNNNNNDNSSSDTIDSNNSSNSSSSTITTTTVIANNTQNNNKNGSSSIFKKFNPESGQFIAPIPSSINIGIIPSNASTTNLHSLDSGIATTTVISPPTTITPLINSNNTTNTNSSNNYPSGLKKWKQANFLAMQHNTKINNSNNKTKMRSQSVPLICHSYRRLEEQFGISSSTTATAGGINANNNNRTCIVAKKKKKSITRSNSNSNMNGYTENNRKKSLLNGLKQAILLNDEKIPYPSSSSSSSLSVSSSVKHRLKTLKQINEIYPIMSNNAIINPGAVIPSLDMPLEVRARYIKESFGVSLDATRNTTAFIKNARQQKEIDIPLPPINLDCLKEIDLTEIVKNPQLRHDIIFDPMLQFRPNMDGERGLKKRKISEKYWNDVSIEISVYLENSKLFDINANRLVPLFNSLKEILISLVPEKDIQNISLVLDTDLIIQQFLNKSLNISDFADWLTQLFKSHCAPMRDIWVDSINKSFKDAEATNSINKLIDSFKSVFQLLEAMKLDIANHQIRILRPALISNAIEFERQYFHTLMASKRINLRNSLEWFSTKYTENFNKSDHKLSPYPLIPDCYNVCAKSIIQLLSCRKMVKEFPLALSFDHTRLTLLRADIRQIVCLLVCRLLFKQMVINETSIGTTANSSIENRMERDYIFQQYTNKNLRDDIISIITDQHGNCRWTKNTMSISIHLCKKIAELRTDYALHVEARKGKRDFVREVSPTNYINVVKTNNVSNGRTPTNIQLDRSKIEFAKSWLSKQTQPLSEVYTVLETRVFNYLQDTIIKRSHITEDGQVNQDFINLVGADEQHQAQINGISTDGSITITRGSNVVNNTTTTDAESVTNSNKNKNGFDRDKEDKIQSDITNPNGVNKDNSNITGFMKNSFELEEVDALCTNLYIVINLHWSVFGFYYVDYVRQKLKKMFQAKEGAKGENDNDSAGAEIKVLLGDNK